jgi:hypothetical protein
MVVCAMICSLALLGCNFPRQFDFRGSAGKVNRSADMKSGLGYHVWEVPKESFVSPFQKVRVQLWLYVFLSDNVMHSGH